MVQKNLADYRKINFLAKWPMLVIRQKRVRKDEDDCKIKIQFVCVVKGSKTLVT